MLKRFNRDGEMGIKKIIQIEDEIKKNLKK